VYSARYAGPEKDHDKNMNLLLENLSGKTDRSAQFKTVITFIDHSGSKVQFSGTIEGTITLHKQGSKGFGYDPIFLPDGADRTFAQMTPEEKNARSHRARAFEKLVTHLNMLK
ncbi:MAG: non-canonical purine NTP pyrophosphatase, partial [Bacteroidota bacterium]